MNIEHDEIMQEKLEKMSEHLEELVIDAFMSVLNRLKEQNKIVLKLKADELILF